MVEMSYLLLLYSLGFQLSFDMHKAIVETFSFWRSFRSLEVLRGHQKVKLWIRCCYCIPRVPSFRLICIKPQLKHFHFGGHLGHQRQLRGHQKVKHWIFYCYCIHRVPSFRLLCIKPQLKYFLFVEVIRGHQRSLKFNFIL